MNRRPSRRRKAAIARARHAGGLRAVPGLGVLIVSAGAPVAAAALDFTTHWIANSAGPGQEPVQTAASALAVAPDGTCYVSNPAGGHDAGIYRAGKVLGKCGTPGRPGRTGGEAVAVSERWVFVAMSIVGGGPAAAPPGDRPPVGTTWFGVARHTLDGKPSAFPGGRGDDGAMLVINESTGGTGEAAAALAKSVRGLCVHEGELFASDPVNGRVRVIDAETMREKRAFRADHPGDLVVLAGALHVVERDRVISTFSLDGRRTGQLIDEEIEPTALAAGADGRLLVADSSARQQVLFYNVGGVPTVVRTLGQEEGVHAPPRTGRTGPLRFNGLVGVGGDRDGNIYVACHPPGGGCVLRSFKPDRKTLNWELLGLETNAMAVVNPSTDGAEVWTAHKSYSFDPAAKPGESWVWLAQTANRFRYPDDLRLTMPMRASRFFVNGGRKSLAVHDRARELIGFLRIDGSTAAPVCWMDGRRARTGGVSVPGVTGDGGWSWRDANGDGRIGKDEVSVAGSDDAVIPPGFIDGRGDHWQLGAGGMLSRRRSSGLDAAGVPAFGSANDRDRPRSGAIRGFGCARI